MPWLFPLDVLVIPGAHIIFHFRLRNTGQFLWEPPTGVMGVFSELQTWFDRIFFFFFWLWSKMFSCHHFTVFSSNPFFKHGQQLVDLSPPLPPPPPHLHTNTQSTEPHHCLVLPWSLRNYSFSLAGEHVWNGFVFTHLVSDAGLFNYSPSACHQRAASCSRQAKRLHVLRQAVGSNRVLPPCCCFLPFLSASQGIPPKLLRRRYQNCESLLAPRAEGVQGRMHGTADPRWGFPPSHQEPCNQMCSQRLVFLAVAPSFSSTLIHSFVSQHVPLFLFLSVLPTAADPARAGSLSPSAVSFPCSRLWLLPLRAGSPKTHDSLTMNNQYRYWSVENVCKFLKGNQEHGAGRLVGDDAEVLVAAGSRTGFGSQGWLAPRWRYRNACERGCARVSARVTPVFCIPLSLQLLSPKNQEPNGREPPSVPCLGCGPALFCFHYHTLLCNLHKYRVIFYRVAQKIKKKKKKRNRSLCCVQEGLAALIMAKDLAYVEGSGRNTGKEVVITERKE